MLSAENGAWHMISTVFVSYHCYYLCILTKCHHQLTSEITYGFYEKTGGDITTFCLPVHFNRACRQTGHTLQETNSFSVWNNNQLQTHPLYVALALRFSNDFS